MKPKIKTNNTKFIVSLITILVLYILFWPYPSYNSLTSFEGKITSIHLSESKGIYSGRGSRVGSSSKNYLISIERESIKRVVSVKWKKNESLLKQLSNGQTVSVKYDYTFNGYEAHELVNKSGKLVEYRKPDFSERVFSSAILVVYCLVLFVFLYIVDLLLGSKKNA